MAALDQAQVNAMQGEWSIANLGPLRDYLRAQRGAGRYVPSIPYGLD